MTAAPVALRESERRAGGRGHRPDRRHERHAERDRRDAPVRPQQLVQGADDHGRRVPGRRSPRARASSRSSTSSCRARDPDDGGAYDGLAAPGVVAQVVDDDTSSIVFVPVGDSTLLVSENATGPLPKTDSYRLRLAHAPNGPVTLPRPGRRPDEDLDVGERDVRADARPDVRRREHHAHDLRPGDRRQRQGGAALLAPRADITSDLDNFLGLELLDVAQGLVATIDGDPTARYDAEVVGGDVKVIGRRAFTASSFNGTIISSVPAFTGKLTVTLDAADLAIGRIWSITLDGVQFEYRRARTRPRPRSPRGLIAAVNVSERFRATRRAAARSRSSGSAAAPTWRGSARATAT